MSDKGKAGRVSLRLLCLSALVFSSLTLASACGSKTQPTQQPTAAYVRLVSSEHGFSLEYPSSYKSADVSPSERPSGALYMRQWWTGTTTSPVYMWVVVNPPSAWGNGADAKLVLRTMRKMYGAGKGERPEETNVKLRAARLTTVAGLPAAYSERSYTEDGAARVERFYWLRSRDVVYEVGYWTAAEEASRRTAEFDHVVSSFTVLP